MRVAIVSPYDLDVPGGVQSHVQHLAVALRGVGVEAVTVSPGHSDREGHVAVGTAVRVPFNDSVAPIALNPAAARRTLAALADIAPDVVHVHEPGVPWVSLAAALRSPVPVVGTFHSWSERDRAYRLARPVVARAVRRLSALVAVSDAAAGYHAAALGMPAGRFRVIPNGVDVATYAAADPLPEVVDDPRPHLLFVGRLERRKGLEQLIRAFTILKSTRPDVRLLVAGSGPERDRCQALLPARLRPDVAFLGYVDEDEKRRFLRSCDVFVAPALGGESFGIVLLEAMAAGCAVVASDIPGYRSVARDGVDARLVPPGDARALAQAIGSLLDNPALRQAMAKEAVEAAHAYDWAEVSRRLVEVYRAARRGGEAGTAED